MSNKSKKIKTEDNEDATIELYRIISQQAKHTSRSKLLECLQQEQINSVRDKVGDAVAEVARQYTELGTDRRWVCSGFVHLANPDEQARAGKIC